MMTILLRFSAVTLLFLAAIVGFASDDERGSDTGKASDLRIAATATLGGKDRYLTHLSTDKPIYRPGETLHARAVVLHHETHQPLLRDGSDSVIEVIGPKGNRVSSGMGLRKEGVIGFRWAIPSSLPGGEYKLKISSLFGYPPAERKFDIRSYRPPRLKSQIKFLRKGYGPGDEAVATLTVERAEGGIPANAKVTITARVDGKQVFEGKSSVSEAGRCVARFQLPRSIPRGEGTLAMTIQDGGVIETASKTIPILLQTVDLVMYPEGGDLINGQMNRVYFEAKTPARKPADLAGEIYDNKGNQVGSFRSEHEGRGRFAFSPVSGRQYHLRITSPSGIKASYPLPKAKQGGVVLRSMSDVYDSNQPIRLFASDSTKKPNLRVTLSKRERVVATVHPEGTNGAVRFDLAASDPHGVLIATVWNNDGKPLAERLIYRRPSNQVQVRILTGEQAFVPGGKAKLTLQTTDAAGEPVSAVVGVNVTDDSVLEMIDKREQSPRLPVMVLLENDTRELADAHVYLDPDNPQSPIAVDLLLGTQGWRRFAFVSPQPFTQKYGDDALRALAKHFAMPGFSDRFRGRVARRELFLRKSDGLPAAPQNAVEKKNNDLAAELVAERPPAEAADKPAKEVPARQQAAQKPIAAAGAKKRKAIARDVAERRLGGFGGGAFGGGRFGANAMRNDFKFVRVYAHSVRSDREPNQRIDFTETVYWNAALRTNNEGKATIEFDLNDSVTSFAVVADAHTNEGVLGSGITRIESVEPFYLEPKLPLEVTAGDRIHLPVTVVNETGQVFKTTELDFNTHPALRLAEKTSAFESKARSRSRKLHEIVVGSHLGPAEVSISARAGAYSDRVTRKLAIQPRGFPMEIASGGLIGVGEMRTSHIVIPKDVIPESLRTRLVVYPTPLANLTESLKGLIRQPSGCFEQTSSTVYPLVMAQQYFLSHKGVDPSLIEKSGQILETGYQRLMGFECAGHGFEWFGKDPGHDALTAYGLMEFTDMAEVQSVDAAMLERTRKWLLQQRDGKGGYLRKARTLHTWLAEPEIAFSYNTWALLKAGINADLTTEVSWVKNAADKSSNTYVVALAGNVLAMSGDRDGATICLIGLLVSNRKTAH